ncbi:MAG TPA: pitrilysin family protein [Myxococcota bacterium]|nr:pitrilysin family protein [Myxococcota bacterium]
MHRSMMRGVRLMPLFVFLSLAASAGTDRKVDFPRPDIKEWQLANGLDVIYLGVHKTPLVTVQVWYHAGSKDEPRDRRGSAHMFEHIMFKGTRHVPPEEHARMLDKLGGSVNAFTTEDMTAFHDTLPRQYMDFAMHLEAERMQHLLFLKKTIGTEREVVKEEIRRRENHPIARALERFRELAFIKHPYAWDAGGRIGDLDKTTPADLERFYKSYYHPINAILIVVGDVEEKQVRECAERWFGSIAKGSVPPRPAQNSPEPVQTMLREERREPAQLGVIIGGYKIPAAKNPDLIPLQVLESVLSQGDSSRLHRRIVRDDKVGVFAGTYLQQFEDPGLMLVFGAYLKPEQGAKLRADLLDEVAKLQKTPLDARQLEKAKNQLAAHFVYGLQHVEGLAYQIGVSSIMTGDARAWLDDYGKILAVSADDVMRVAKTYLTPERLTLVTVPPLGPGAKGGAR